MSPTLQRPGPVEAEVAALARTVTDSASHLVGNLLQRLRALAEEAQRSAPTSGQQLAETLTRLEDTLRALFDFWDLPEGHSEPYAALEVLQSFIAALRGSLPANVDCRRPRSCPEVTVTVDPQRLSVAWRALCRVLLLTHQSSTPLGGLVELALEATADQRHLWLALALPDCWRVPHLSEWELWWAVASKALLGQGGQLTRDHAQGRDRMWRIQLPIQS